MCILRMFLFFIKTELAAFSVFSGTFVRRLRKTRQIPNHDNAAISPFFRPIKYSLFPPLGLATFHILTPYPTTALYERMAQQGRLLHSNWDVYDTRHVVYRPAKLTSEALEAGYWRAHRDFYR